MPVNEWDVLCLRMLFLYEMAKGGQQSQHEKYNHKLYILVFIVFFFSLSKIDHLFSFLFLVLSAAFDDRSKDEETNAEQLQNSIVLFIKVCTYLNIWWAFLSCVLLVLRYFCLFSTLL